MSKAPTHRVKQFVDHAASGNLDLFLSHCQYPVLVASGGEAQESEGFKTRAVATVDFVKILKASRLDPNSRVLFLEKRPGLNPYSQMIIVGRTPNSDIHLANSEISKMHAYITWADSSKGRTFQIADGNSSNGTWINKKKLLPRIPHDLTSGEIIGLGGTVFLRFFYPKDFFSSLRK